MGWFEKKRQGAKGGTVQLREGGRHPFGLLDGYVPLHSGEIPLYRSIREAVPIVDAAVLRGGAIALGAERWAEGRIPLCGV